LDIGEVFLKDCESIDIFFGSGVFYGMLVHPVSEGYFHRVYSLLFVQED